MPTWLEALGLLSKLWDGFLVWLGWLARKTVERGQVASATLKNVEDAARIQRDLRGMTAKQAVAYLEAHKLLRD